MGKRILIIQGHPDRAGSRFGHALAAAYGEGAAGAGHAPRWLEIAKLEFPLLRSKEEWARDVSAGDLRKTQEDIDWADHLVVFFPLWLGTMPAILKGFLEQTLRPGFAFEYTDSGRSARKRLKGKSAPVVVTMGMPACLYRVYFRAHGVRGLERSILRFCGVAPVRETFIGMVERRGSGARSAWVRKLRELGRQGR